MHQRPNHFGRIPLEEKKRNLFIIYTENVFDDYKICILFQTTVAKYRLSQTNTQQLSFKKVKKIDIMILLQLGSIIIVTIIFSKVLQKQYWVWLALWCITNEVKAICPYEIFRINVYVCYGLKKWLDQSECLFRLTPGDKRHHSFQTTFDILLADIFYDSNSQCSRCQNLKLKGITRTVS